MASDSEPKLSRMKSGAASSQFARSYQDVILRRFDEPRSLSLPVQVMPGLNFMKETKNKNQPTKFLTPQHPSFPLPLNNIQSACTMQNFISNTAYFGSVRAQL